jgi:hypothetical protein
MRRPRRNKHPAVNEYEGQFPPELPFFYAATRALPKILNNPFKKLKGAGDKGDVMAQPQICGAVGSKLLWV